MKKSIIVTFAVAISVIGMAYAPIGYEPVERTNASPTESNCIDEACSNHHGKPTPCPEGSYSIGFNEQGENVCKAEPTGCPYGDSIPLDICYEKFGNQEEGNDVESNSEVRNTRTAESQEKQSTTCK